MGRPSLVAMSALLLTAASASADSIQIIDLSVADPALAMAAPAAFLYYPLSEGVFTSCHGIFIARRHILATCRDDFEEDPPISDLSFSMISPGRPISNPISRMPVAEYGAFKLFEIAKDVSETWGTAPLSDRMAIIGEEVVVVASEGGYVWKDCRVDENATWESLDIRCSYDYAQGWVFSAQTRKLLGYMNGPEPGHAVIRFLEESALMRQLANQPPVLRETPAMRGFVPAETLDTWNLDGYVASSVGFVVGSIWSETQQSPCSSVKISADYVLVPGCHDTGDYTAELYHHLPPLVNESFEVVTGNTLQEGRHWPVDEGGLVNSPWALLLPAKLGNDIPDATIATRLPDRGEPVVIVRAHPWEKSVRTDCAIGDPEANARQDFGLTCSSGFGGYLIPGNLVFSAVDGALLGFGANHPDYVPRMTAMASLFDDLPALEEIANQQGGLPPALEQLARRQGEADGLAGVVLGCFRNGAQTVQDMHACSGFWVTPKALLLCAMRARCPVLPDTPEGIAVLQRTLALEDMSIGSVLTFKPEHLPKLEPDDISACQDASRDVDFARCVLERQSAAEFPELATCAGIADSSEAATCAISQLGGEAEEFFACTGGDLDKLGSCLDPGVAHAQSLIESCVRRAANRSQSIECLTDALPGKGTEVADCVFAAAADGPSECIAHLAPSYPKVRAAVECIGQHGTEQQTAACVARLFPGREAHVAACLAESGSKGAISCLFGDSREVQAAYLCASSTGEPADLIAKCSGDLLDENSRQALTCVAKADDEAGLAGCAAAVALPPEMARLAGCASQSQGAASFALCAAAPQMNEEWMIAAGCALESGGNPAYFAGCTASRLTIRELTKCFNGKFGKDCFGPNNTIVKTLKNAFSDVTEGPGKNNEVVKALDDLEREIGELGSALESLVFDNPLSDVASAGRSTLEQVLNPLGLDNLL